MHRRAGVRGAPVIAFVHGGAFVRGAKDAGDGTYGNVLDWFAEQGCVGVNVEYRLAPEAAYPEGALDVAAACAWIRANAAVHGGDPERLCLVGHSAGGTHVATLACDPHPAVRAAPRHGARSLVLLSARLRADLLATNPNADGVRAYLGAGLGEGGDGSGLLDARSPVAHAARIDAPVLVVNAEFENPLLDLYGLEFALAVGRARGAAPLHVTLADHNHVSLVAHMGTEERWLGDAILRFAAGCERLA